MYTKKPYWCKCQWVLCNIKRKKCRGLCDWLWRSVYNSGEKWGKVGGSGNGGFCGGQFGTRPADFCGWATVRPP